MKVKEMKADPGSGVWLQRKTLKFLEKVTPAKWGRVSNSEERERNSPTCSYLVKKKKKKTSAEMLVVMEMVRQYAVYKNSNMGAFCVRD